MSPKVSVILSTYNHIKYIQMSVESILKQTFTDFEFIIIQDGSTDNTQDYLDGLSDSRVKVIVHEVNQGIIPSYNEGLKYATGDYVTWISSDNYYMPSFLETFVKYLDEHNGIIFVYSSFHWVNSEGKRIRTNHEQYIGVHALLLDNPGIASFMYRNSLHDQIGYLDPSIGVASDTDFWIRMIELIGLLSTAFIPKVLCYFMWDKDSDSMKRYHTTYDSIRGMVKSYQDRRIRTRGVNAPIRVLFIVPNFVPELYAGVEVYTYNMAKKLREQGVEVSVLYPKLAQTCQIIESEYDGIPIYNILYNGDPSSTKLTIENPQAEDLFIKLLDKHQFDIFHFHHTYGLPFSLIRLVNKMGYPVCLTLHDFWFLCERMYLYKTDGTICGGPSGIDDCVDCLLEGWSGEKHSIDEVASTFFNSAYRTLNNKEIMANCIDVLTCPSRYVYDIFTSRGFGYGKMEIVPLGVEPPRPLTYRDIDNRDLVLGYAGVINPVKNLITAIKAVRATKIKSIKLYIWGSGRESDITALHKEIELDKNIEYEEPFIPSELPRIYSMIDISIIPSLIESYSLQARESLSAGVPVIGTNVGGLCDIINRGHNGYLFDPLDVDELTDLLKWIFVNREILEHWRSMIKGTPASDELKEIAKKMHIKSIGEDAEDWVARYTKLIKKGD